MTTFAFVGTFTQWADQQSEGIYQFALDEETGSLDPVGTTPIVNPSFLAVSPSRGVVYTATHSSHFEGEAGAGVVGFAIDTASGGLTRINHQLVPSPHPAYINVDRSERFVLIASGLGGAASVFPLDDDGRLAAASDVQQFEGEPSVRLGTATTLPLSLGPGAPHPHCIAASPDNRFVLVSNLGHNRVHVFRFDSERGKLEPGDPPWHDSPPGVQATTPIGARHMAFHPAKEILYVNNEGHSSVTVFAWDAAAGRLSPLQTVSTLPDGADGSNSSADIHVHSSGRFLYVSNRGHDSIASFTIDDSGLLAPLAHEPTRGEHPRNFALTPDGRLLLAANQKSETIVAFRIDEETGALEPTGSVTAVPSPVCVKFAVV